MPDVFTKAKRSEIMSQIRGRGNKATELKVMELFKQNGIIGWRRNYKLFGRPDFVFRKQRIAVFVDGDFWHGHPKSTIPQTNRAFWRRKINRNKARDRLVNLALHSKSWNVIRIWQGEIRNLKWLARLTEATKSHILRED